ncbi:MAG: helix-turn-helix transcriptional regulator [Candidatus Hodarchaeota archaeon]
MARKSTNEIALDTLVQELKRELLPLLSVPRRYLNEEETGRYLSLSIHTLRQWRSRGEENGPPYLKIGSSIRYDVQSLDAWIEQFKVKE